MGLLGKVKAYLGKKVSLRASVIDFLVNKDAAAKELEKKSEPEFVNIRGASVSKEDFDSYFRPTFFGEVSNRTTEKKRLEADVILNTMLNRVSAHKERGKEKSLRDIISEPNQYQAYGGSQYALYKNATSTLDLEKKKEIDSIADSMWKEMSEGKYADNTNGAHYYIHNKDGSITYDDKRPLFAR